MTTDYYKKLILDNVIITYLDDALKFPSPGTTYINVSDENLTKYSKKKLSELDIKLINAPIFESDDNNTLDVTSCDLRDAMRLLIWQLRAGNKVIIFCNHGFNRSPGTVILALMKYAGMTFDDASEECKNIRVSEGPFLCNEHIVDILKQTYAKKYIE